ncbi:MAG: Gldg family protein [Planctomycetota bacterium]
MKTMNVVTRLRPSDLGDRRDRGAVLGNGLHVVLLLLVLGQLVYLASRYRVRLDATEDQLFSLTESTRKIVGGLEKRLIIEAYLSPKEDLPAQFRDTRTVLENFLDELVQLGRGKVAVQRFNPLDDKAIQEKCTRIGIKPIDAQTQTTSAMSVQRHWQGLRLVYGGGKQKVLEQIGPQSSFLAEAVLTPAIKEVVTEQKRKIGYMEWPSQAPGQQGQALAWNFVRTVDDVAKRYEFQNFKDAEGALIPDDIGTLMLFRPRDLTDRQKYVVDQFVMRGGTLVLFADVADYALAPRRQCSKLPLSLDAQESEYKWQEQLLNYGIDQTGRIVADMAQQAMQARNPLMQGWEYFGIPVQQFARQVAYPYFFHAVDGDWAQVAERLASMGGRLDQEQKEYFERTLRPGIDSDEFLFKAFKQLKRGPGFYWPAAIQLRRGGAGVDLPEGVEGRALLWSSPLTITEDPPASLNPLQGADLQAQTLANQAFMQKLNTRVQSEARKQWPLMLDLHGDFPSFFVGKPRPKKASELAEEDARKAAEAEAAGKDEAPAPADPDVGPPPPEKKQDPTAESPPAVPDPEPLQRAAAGARILVIADSDFLRDDFLQGAYQQAGGPRSLFGGAFFLHMLDWLSQDSDLVELQSRIPIDRKLELIEPLADRAEDRRDTEKRLRTATNVLVTANVLAPAGVLLLLGLGVMTVRRAQKKAFLESVGN